MVFMAQYFNEHVSAVDMYLLYDHKMHAMDRVFGDGHSGFHAVRFRMDEVESCKPYAFVVFTADLKIYRLPEDVRYFCATSAVGNGCNVNHFYNDPINGKWVANGSPDIYDLDLIVGVNNSQCNSCEELDQLSREYNDWVLSVDIGIETTSSPFQFPTKRPTVRPTSNPTLRPSNYPTSRPSKIPTSRPTMKPIKKRQTNNPTSKPTKRPTASLSNAPTTETTVHPNPLRYKIPLTEDDSLEISDTWTSTQIPSTKPTKYPTSRPSEKDSSERESGSLSEQSSDQSHSDSFGMNYRTRRVIKNRYSMSSDSDESDS